MTDEEIIEFAKRSGYGPIVKVPVGRVMPPKIAVVDLGARPPAVIRWEDPIAPGQS